MLKHFVKRLRRQCKHDHKQCITNLHGDFIDVMSGYKDIYRSVWFCEDCGKFFLSPYLDKSCKSINFMDSQFEDIVWVTRARDKDGNSN